MIDNIELSSYGKFREQNFKFGPFTVVYGPNEAGKTTLFDALFEAACADAPKRGQVWTRLSSRYGEERTFRAGGKVPAFKDAVEFLELYSIRSGQINIEAEKGGSWAEAAKNSLYQHGFNPAELAEALEKRTSVSNATKHQKNLNRLNAALAEYRARIAELRAQEAAVVESKGQLEKLEAEIQVLETKKSGLEADISSARAVLEKHKADRAVAQAQRDRDFAAEAVRNEAKLKELAACKADAVGGYDELLGKINETERGLAEISGTITAGRDMLQRLQAESLGLEEELAIARREAAAAAGLLPEVGKIISLKSGALGDLPAKARYGIWAAGAALAALGLFISRHTWLGDALAVSGAVGAFALDRYLFRPKDSASGLAKEKAKLAAIFDRWVNLGFDRAKLARETAEGVQEALLNLKAMPGACETAIANNRKDALSARKAVEALENNVGSLEQEKDSYAAQGRAWLAAAGCANRDEYLAKAGQYTALGESAAKNSGRLKELLELEKCSSAEALLALLDSRVKELEAKGARARPDADRDIAAQEFVIKELADARQALEDELNPKNIERENLSVTFNKDLAKVPETLNELRVREFETEREIEADELLRRGAEWAARIYREIEADSVRKFAILAEDVRKLLVKVLPQSELNIARLDLGGVSMKDAGGALRELDDLSAGTRDCFMLAARLTLAGAARGDQPGLLLLDDPFGSFDAERRAAALRLLKSFQLDTGWQIILFTKDQTLLYSAGQDPQIAVCSLA